MTFETNVQVSSDFTKPNCFIVVAEDYAGNVSAVITQNVYAVNPTSNDID